MPFRGCETSALQEKEGYGKTLHTMPEVRSKMAVARLRTEQELYNLAVASYITDVRHEQLSAGWLGMQRVMELHQLRICVTTFPICVFLVSTITNSRQLNLKKHDTRLKMKSAPLFLAVVGTAVGQGQLGCFCSDDVIWRYPILEVAQGVCCFAAVLRISNLVNCPVEPNKVDQFARCCQYFNAYAVCK